MIFVRKSVAIPLDTTRIFVYYTDDSYSTENEYINTIPDQFCSNRTSGGIPEFGAVSILANFKQRTFQIKD
ncbi:MAG: hypothetical protein K0Q87_1718 [Neobacillus sp.]|jgi:hypothetical protein|nr:hypothetical protein [Neobacillus sp.]